MKKLLTVLLFVAALSPFAGAKPKGNANGSGGTGTCPIGSSQAECKSPEIDPASGMNALALIAGSLVILRSRRKRSAVS